MKNEKSDGELSGALTAAWEKYKAFWEVYAELFAGKGSQSNIGSYEDLANRLRRWREGPGDKELDDLLEYLVHPKDLKAFRGDSSQDLKLGDNELWNLKQFVYGLRDPKATGEERRKYKKFDGEQPVPMLPQPYYGRLENAKIVVVFNNPAYDQSVWEDGSDWDRIKGRMEAHISHLKANAPVVPWESSTDWLPAGGGYYVKRFNPDKKGSKYLLSECDEGEAAGCLFHLDMIPYQSLNGGDPYVKKIWGDPAKLPSVQENLKLLYAIFTDQEDRAIIFRKQDSLRAFEDYVCDMRGWKRGEESIVKLNAEPCWRKRIYMMAGGQNSYLTFNNLTMGDDPEIRKNQARDSIVEILKGGSGSKLECATSIFRDDGI